MMQFLQLQQWLACAFCAQTRATHHGLCKDCWQALPWDLSPSLRQEVQFTASCYYAYPLNRVIHGFKDQAQLHYLNLLSACLKQLPKPQADAIVPMPISTEKLLQRGFSQTDLLAKALSKHWKIPIWQPVTRHYGDSQRGMDRAQRLHHLESQFYIRRSPTKSYKKVVMLDDVITTGASLSALQQQLQNIGCDEIQAFCLCNVQKH